MPSCPSCHAAVAEDARFCPACGNPVGSITDLPTSPGPVNPPSPDDLAATTPTDPGRAAGGPSRPPLTGSLSSAGLSGDGGRGGRFLPGSMVADRYRVIGLLGKGGMGEVYRADDLKLGQPVALKFLPPGLEADTGRLDRFLGEVRTARQVTHPNVCRVYDVGEVTGPDGAPQHFLSMEYIDGEDLASLLRRIGRLPQERAVQVARQICAGLAAAHEQGILHRDLKPANIMIDGRGGVRITDFGLAGLAAEIGEGDITAGTPAYMAPEQLRGEAVTIQSDLYALGLVLYEVFTGKAAFSAKTVAELKELHQSATPSSPATHVSDLDPAAERALLHCLEKDPVDRPKSALAVSASLPGGDPLAAALAAGETPSPELIASTAVSNAMHPLKALGLALLALLVFVGAVRWAGSQSVLAYLDLSKRPEVLEDKARSILADLGYTEAAYTDPVDRAWGYIQWSGVIGDVGRADSSDTRWEGLRARPDAASYWYRQSPGYIFPNPSGGPAYLRGPVRITNPTPTNAGEVTVGLDLAGRLRRFEVAPRRYSMVDTAGQPDWNHLFALAELDPARFTETRPVYQRFLAPEVNRSWLGTRAEQPEDTLRVSAGSFEGRLVLFNLAPEGNLRDLGATPEPSPMSTGQFLSQATVPVIVLLLLGFAMLLARRNLHRGRADRRGAMRASVAFFVLTLVSTSLTSHVLWSEVGLSEAFPLVISALFFGAVAYVFYLAAEPLGRQVWPAIFVSSSRLLSRPRIQWRDPVIGRTVLVGMVAGAVLYLIQQPLGYLVRSADLGMPAPPPSYDFDLFLGQRSALGNVLGQVLYAILFAFLFLTLLVVVRYFVKRQWPAIGVTWVLWMLLSIANNGASGIGIPLVMGVATIQLLLLLRLGLIGLAVANIVLAVGPYARSVDWASWHSQGATTALIVVTGLALYGVWAATGGGRAVPAGSAERP